MTLRTLPFWLVDVFAREPLSGNGLSVFLLDEELSTHAMQSITQEMRQFETIFLRRIEQSTRFNARIFTMEEELPFAGHPVIGAAALLHSELFSKQDVARLEFAVRDRSINVVSRRQGKSYIAEMDQGVATVEPPISAAMNETFLKALNLSISDLAPDQLWSQRNWTGGMTSSWSWSSAIGASAPSIYRAPSIIAAPEVAKSELGPDDEIVVYCSGDSCPASKYAYQVLTERGYENVRRYAGGIADWEETGYPLEGEMLR